MSSAVVEHNSDALREAHKVVEIQFSDEEAKDADERTRLGTDEDMYENCSPTLAVRRSQSFTLFSTDWLSKSFSQDDGPSSPFSFLGGAAAPSSTGTADEDSVGSAAYYDPSDLNPAYWMKAMDAPTFGFAVVALATAITHPLLFVAGALTAFGTARAAGAGYDFYKNDGMGPLARIFCWNGSPTADEEDTTSDESPEPAEPPYVEMAPAPVQPTVINPLSPTESDISDQWLYEHYPKMDNHLLKEDGFVGLSTVEFFTVFFDDDAPYNFRAFQEKRGDFDIDYSEWKNIKIGTDALSVVSLHPRASETVPLDLEPLAFRERVIRFKAKTGSFFGPPYASTTKTQRILVVNKRFAVLECKTMLADIPFCDSFFVMERWVIRADKVDDRYNSTVSIDCEVIFVKPCTFEYQIRTKSRSTLNDVTHAWCRMAQEALKLAEERKLDRLRHSMNSADEHDEEKDGEHKDAEDVAAPQGVDGASVDESIEVDKYYDDERGVLTIRRSESESDMARLRCTRRPSLNVFRRSISQMGALSITSRKRLTTFETRRFGRKPTM